MNERNPIQIFDLAIAYGVRFSLGAKASSVKNSTLLSAVRQVNSMSDMINGEMEEAKSGQEIRDYWNNLLTAIRQKIDGCTERYEDCAARVQRLEDEKNACYIQQDNLKKQSDELQPKLKGLEVNISEIKKQMMDLSREIANLQGDINELEEKKKTYDILRYIPIVNIFSEIAAAIDNTREKLKNRQDAARNLQEKLDGLNRQRRELQHAAGDTDCKIQEIIDRISRITAQEENLQKQRDSASKEMIEWKNRERYCKQILDELEYRIKMGADVDELRKVIEDNPPPFPLAA